MSSGSALGPAPDRANPDPLAFGTVVAGPKQQLTALLHQVPAVKEDPEQDVELQNLLRKIRKVQSLAAKHGVALPAEADTAVFELTRTLVGFAVTPLRHNIVPPGTCIACIRLGMECSVTFGPHAPCCSLALCVMQFAGVGLICMP